ncbi:hypothetical protein K1719_041536 [Acacia pycnantha]|nr:hypothetical protein K1719_041536 [Acacia pycnantha]
MNNGSRKRPPPPSQHSPANQPKSQAFSQEDEFVDEDVFLDETLISEDEESIILRDIEQRQALASRIAKWTRPHLSSEYLLQSCSIYFQQLEIDYVIGESHKELLPNSSGAAAIIRIFGVTKEGHSVCCNVHGFEPYFYISCPPGMRPDDISGFHKILEGRMKESNRNSKVPQFVRRIEMVQRKSIMHYQQQNSQPFLKIVVALPTMVASCRGILDRGIQIDGLGMKSFMTYESNVLFALRFMIDCNIVGGNWIEVPAGKYKKTAKNLSYCQLEFDCLYSELISHAPEGDFSKMAPFRILSFDIECAGRKGHFPEPTHDPVIQIANLVTLQGEGQPFIRNVMTLKSCSPIVGTEVMSFDTEREVLLAWRDFIREVDPDIIIGYNICKFDLPYLIERADALKIVEFPILGRIRSSRVRVKDTTFSSRQLGTRESKEVTIEGRVQFDLLQAMQRDHKLSSYSLNSVSAHFLSEQKEDVHHSIISDLQNGNADTRRRLAVYCLKLFIPPPLTLLPRQSTSLTGDFFTWREHLKCLVFKEFKLLYYYIFRAETRRIEDGTGGVGTTERKPYVEIPEAVTCSRDKRSLRNRRRRLWQILVVSGDLRPMNVVDEFDHLKGQASFKSWAKQTEESYQLQQALALRLSSQAASADDPNFLDLESSSSSNSVEAVSHPFWVNGCLQYSDKIPDGFYLIHGMDAYSWTICADLQNVGLIPSFESLMSVEPSDDLSVVVVAIDKTRNPGLRELLNGIVCLFTNRITKKDVIDHLANLVCSRLGGETWTEETLASRWKENMEIRK